MKQILTFLYYHDNIVIYCIICFILLRVHPKKLKSKLIFGSSLHFTHIKMVSMRPAISNFKAIRAPQKKPNKIKQTKYYFLPYFRHVSYIALPNLYHDIFLLSLSTKCKHCLQGSKTKVKLGFGRFGQCRALPRIPRKG